MLKRHFEWANPIHSSFYYCTAVDVNGAGCTYANDSEKAVQDHIRERHPGSGATPRRFGMSPLHGGMATIGPSCSITAVVAAVCTMPGLTNINTTLLRAFRGSTADTAREVIGALGLQLPTSPGWALEKLTAQDDTIGRAFAATARQDVYCSWCGVTEEGQPEPQIATVTYEAPAGGLPGTTATAISEAFGHVSANCLTTARPAAPKAPLYPHCRPFSSEKPWRSQSYRQLETRKRLVCRNGRGR
ncbi:hypothetical_protein (plasmid) [Leishmania braziliensis MHOM/BR/75/M2904]|uniref:Hypothetical_protein n=1 Tax=Leishmania braziliensis MHOM/BR/75/M2904 TaxID=420245 RepID=A0A3P3YWT7_LEIBR|nr:hypothetical_protein [Leishmania braziliensis MHOM/BR/75/M2904]